MIQVAPKIITALRPLRWNFKALSLFIAKALNGLRKQNKLGPERSYWWYFIHRWPKDEQETATRFLNGFYRFEPLKTYFTKQETVVVWTYVDRLFIKALLSLIKPSFKHIISSRCLHLKGPAGVKSALNLTQKAFNKGGFRYFMRVDIKGYYASIDRRLLTSQVQKHFNDARVLNYLEQIINIPVIENAAVYTPLKGIPRRSSLSPFFGALYLSPLDRGFENFQNIWYLRYMDDILILTKTKKQFCKAKRRLQQILSQLKLRCSRRKTKMGPLTAGFHFLGIDFKVNQESSILKVLIKEAEAQTQLLQSQLTITLHERCCIRAMERIRVMEEDLVHPSKVQHYLSKWAGWWCRTTVEISRKSCLEHWILRAQDRCPERAWIGVGLLRPLLGWAEATAFR